MTVLSRLPGSVDLRRLSIASLRALAQQIRRSET